MAGFLVIFVRTHRVVVKRPRVTAENSARTGAKKLKTKNKQKIKENSHAPVQVVLEHHTQSEPGGVRIAESHAGTIARTRDV